MGEFDETKVFLGKIRIFSESIFTPIFCVFSKILVQNEDIISLSVCKNIEASFTASENEVLPVKKDKIMACIGCIVDSITGSKVLNGSLVIIKTRPKSFSEHIQDLTLHISSII